jgi:hypothetical protein
LPPTAWTGIREQLTKRRQRDRVALSAEYWGSGRLRHARDAATGGQHPSSTEYCSLTCIRPPDPGTPFGGVTGFHFTLAMHVDARNGNLLIADDPLAGVRAFHGHIWSVASVP